MRMADPFLLSVVLVAVGLYVLAGAGNLLASSIVAGGLLHELQAR
jgi:hypothetical protein